MPLSVTVQGEVGRKRIQIAVLAARALLYVFIILFIVVMAAPFIWMISTSLKPTDEVLAYPPTWVPSRPQFSNYPDALSRMPFGRFYLNSIIVTSTVTVSVLFFSAVTYCTKLNSFVTG